jgi:hypothetical protein
MTKVINRIIWQVNRSPLRKIIKLLVRVANIKVVMERVLLASRLPKNSALDVAVATAC